MKRSSLLFFLLLIFPLFLKGQDYPDAAGIRAGFSAGIEYRRFIDYRNSFRLLLSTRDRGLQLHGLYETHRFGIFGFTDDLVFFYGGGCHFGYERWNEKPENKPLHTITRTRVIAGIDGIAGLEFYIPGLPASAGIEIKPYTDFWGRYGFDARIHDFAFTLKYLF